MKTNIPKSTLSGWFKNIKMPSSSKNRLKKIVEENLKKARKLSIRARKIKSETENIEIYNKYKTLPDKLEDNQTALIAFASLCMGDASKSSNSFYFGSSNPKIITYFLGLLKTCFNFELKRIRCSVQCRADQDGEKLTNFWSKHTKISKKYFYKPRIDKRTIGKPTRKSNYKGVLRIDYMDVRIPKTLNVLYNLLPEVF